MLGKRSTVVRLVLLVLVAFALSACRQAGDESGGPVLVVASWGGAYQAAQREAFFEPFARENGVRIIEAGTPPYSKFYEWQRTGEASMDVVDVETFFVLRGGERGALRELDFAVVDTAGLLPGAVERYGVATVAYADVIAWNTGRNPTWRNLTWSSFWDVQSYPGRRGLRDLPASSLEAALLADGVQSDSLYPMDIDRAFRNLDDLRSKTKLALWSSGSTPIEWLTTGAVEMTTAWNGRVFDAQHPPDGSPLPIAMTFPEGAMIDWLWWVVPKDAPHSELAMKFIAFTLRPDRQAAIARLIPYGPTNRGAMDLLPDSVEAHLPTAPYNIARMIVRDNAWWAANVDDVEERWREWKLGLGSQ